MNITQQPFLYTNENAVQTNTTTYSGIKGGYYAGIVQGTNPFLVAAAGAFRYLKVALSAAPGAGENVVISILKNGAPTGITCTISDANTTGSDLVNTSTVVATDLLEYKVVASLNCANAVMYASLTYQSSVYSTSIYATPQCFAVTNNAADIYYGSLEFPFEAGNTGSSHDYSHSIIPADGTIGSLYVHTDGTTPGANNTIVVTLYKNDISTSVTCTLGAASTDANDTTHSISVVKGDIVHWRAAYSGAGAKGIVYAAVACAFNASTPGETLAWIRASKDVGGAVTSYAGVVGYTYGHDSTTEVNKKQLGIAGDIYNQYIEVYAGAGTATATLRLAGVDTWLTSEVVFPDTSDNNLINVITILDGQYIATKIEMTNDAYVSGSYVYCAFGEPLPKLKTGIAIKQPIFTETPTWIQLDNDVMSLNIKRGRNHELDRIEAGTTTITLNNASGYYWRYNDDAGNVLYPDFKPLTLIKITATYNTFTYDLFYGYIESINPGWSDDRGAGTGSIVTLQCVDMFKSFARMFLFGAHASDPTGTMVNSVLTDVNFPAAMRNVQAGTVDVGALNTPTVPDGGTNLLEYLQKLAEAEHGVIFIDGAGLLTFQNRDDRLIYHNTALATFTDAGGDSLYILPEFSDDDTFIYNTARIKGTGTEQVYYDIPAILEQGERAKVNTTSLIENDGDAFDQCYQLVERYKDSVMRCQSLLILPDASPADLYPKVLGYDISTRINLVLNTVQPAIIDRDYHIEGIEHNWSPSEGWSTKWQLWDVNQYKMFRAEHGDYVYNVDPDYDTCHDAATGLAITPDPATMIIGQELVVLNYGIFRGLLQFDTSLLLATDNIVSADIVLKDDTAVTVDEDWALTAVDPGCVAPLVDANYNDFSDTDCGHLDIDAAETTWKKGEWNTIHLNAAGIALIVPEGTTCIGLRSDYDISATPQGVINERLWIHGASSIYPPRLMIKVRAA